MRQFSRSCRPQPLLTRSGGFWGQRHRIGATATRGAAVPPLPPLRMRILATCVRTPARSAENRHPSPQAGLKPDFHRSSAALWGVGEWAENSWSDGWPRPPRWGAGRKSGPGLGVKDTRSGGRPRRVESWPPIVGGAHRTSPRAGKPGRMAGHIAPRPLARPVDVPANLDDCRGPDPHTAHPLF